jgi:hypothetical protein
MLILVVAIVVAEVGLKLAELAAPGSHFSGTFRASHYGRLELAAVPEAPRRLPVEMNPKVPMSREEIVAWIETNFGLGDKRRSRALGLMVCGLMQAGVVSFAAIGRKMGCEADPASCITRVFRFCHNPKVDVAAVQSKLVGLLVPQAAFWVEGIGRLAVVAVDWHSYDNGDISGLRVSLMTGSRALPLLWYEIKTSELKSRRTAIEQQALRDLLKYRPPEVTWLTLLDAGFNAPELLNLLEEVGYYVVRSGSKVVVHSSTSCWTNIGKLPVAVGQIVEFGWLYWNRKNPRRVRLVAARLYDLQPPRPGRRTRQAGRRKGQHPGLCPVITNLPMELFSSVAVIRLYARRFEIEHSFRDIKNATLGMDMEHVHLLEASTYSRLMCIVALTETILWLIGSEAEATGFHKRLTPSRPKDGRRILSLRNVGFLLQDQIAAPIDQLIGTHLPPATARILLVVGRTWKDVKERLVLAAVVTLREEVASLPPNERRKDHRHMKCPSPTPWVVSPEKEVLPLAA